MSSEKVQREYSKDVQDDTESSDVFRSGEVGVGLHRQLKNRHVAMIRFAFRAMPNSFQLNVLIFIVLEASCFETSFHINLIGPRH